MHDGADDPVRATEDAGGLVDLAGAQVVGGRPSRRTAPRRRRRRGRRPRSRTARRGRPASRRRRSCGSRSGCPCRRRRSGRRGRARTPPRTKSSGRLLGELGGEVEHEQAVDAGVGDEVVAHAPGEMSSGACVGPQHGDRVRVEGDRDGGQAEPVAGLDEGVEHRPVPAVDAVEVAEGEDAGPKGLGRLGGVGPAVHGDHSTNSPGQTRRGCVPWDATRRASRRACRRADRGDRLGAPRDGRRQALPVAQGARLRLVDLAHREGRAGGVGERGDRHPLALPRLEVGERVRVGDGEAADPGASQRGQVPAAAERRTQVARERPHVGARRHGDLDVDVEHRRCRRRRPRARRRPRSATR